MWWYRNKVFKRNSYSNKQNLIRITSNLTNHSKNRRII